MGGAEVLLHLFFTSAGGGGDLSASRPGRSTPGKDPGTKWIGRSIGPTAGLRVLVEKDKNGYSYHQHSSDMSCVTDQEPLLKTCEGSEHKITAGVPIYIIFTNLPECKPRIKVADQNLTNIGKEYHENIRTCYKKQQNEVTSLDTSQNKTRNSIRKDGWITVNKLGHEPQTTPPPNKTCNISCHILDLFGNHHM